MSESSELEKNLALFGFTPAETIVYLALLREDTLKVSEISSATKIGRTQLYPLLNRMTKNNWIGATNEKPVSYFAADPYTLIRGFEAERKEQFGLLLDLRSALDKLKPVQTIATSDYPLSIVKGGRKTLSTIISLMNETTAEVIKKGSLDAIVLNEPKEIRDIEKKLLKGKVTIVAHPSSNLPFEHAGNLDRIRLACKGALCWNLASSEPYATYIFDRKKVLLAFHNGKDGFDNSILIEDAGIAESFALGSAGIIEANPLSGELKVNFNGTNEKAFLIPENSLSSLSTEQLFNLGNHIGKSIAGKKAREKNTGINASQTSILKEICIQSSVNGWGKAAARKNSDRKEILKIENHSVDCAFFRGLLQGAISPAAKNMITKTSCVKKGNNCCEFAVG